MGRPPRRRFVACMPRAFAFKPVGIRACDLDQVVLGFDELEAMRLVDFEGLSQEQAAASLGVSRQTVGRVVEQARRTVTDALLHGKALLIDGGAFQVTGQLFCGSCGRQWTLQAAGDISEDVGPSCPDCGRPGAQSYGGQQRSRGSGQGHGRCQGHGRGHGRGS